MYILLLLSACIIIMYPFEVPPTFHIDPCVIIHGTGIIAESGMKVTVYCAAIIIARLLSRIIL